MADQFMAGHPTLSIVMRVKLQRSNITPIATKTGWTMEKLGRIEKKMGIKTANDNMLRGERMK